MVYWGNTRYCDQMDQDKIIREQLLSLLEGGNAHTTFDGATKTMPLTYINANFRNIPYSAWHLLEHLRITQADILDYITNPDYKYMKWPDDYWPPKNEKAAPADWKESIAMFKKDTKALQKIVRDPKTNLYAEIPHGKGETILREILLVADHNAYHIGEFIVLRRVLGVWEEKHI